MGISDITGVFSRYFIVGFFLPSFFALVLLKIALSAAWVPQPVSDDSSQAFLVIGAVALLLGLLLVGLRQPLEYLLSGYPFIRESQRRLYWIVTYPARWARERQLKMFDALKDKAVKRDDETTREYALRRRAERELGVRFPNRRDKVLPTRLGNAIRAWEDRARMRWSLETVAILPHIDLFQSDQESKVHADTQTDFAFFLNSAIGAAVAGATMALNAVAETPHPVWLSWIYALPLLAAFLFYRASVGAARRWGDHVAASIDLHRFDLYEKLGVRIPKTHAEIAMVGPAINRMLLYGEALPDEVLSGPPNAEESTNGVPSDQPPT